MKQKTYRIILLTLLIFTFIINTILLVKTIISVTSFDSTKLMDGIMYIICYLLLLAFNGLQIFNTIASFKKGGLFIRNIMYDDKMQLSRKLIIAVGGIIVLLLAAVVYFGLITVNINLPFVSLDKEISNIIFSFSLLLMIDCIALLLFPLQK